MSEIEENTKRAIRAGIAVLLKGHYPYIPHLTHFVDLLSKEEGIPLRWEDYIDWDLTWIRLCDALLYLGDSRGARLELEYAKRLGKKIFTRLDDIPQLQSRLHNLQRHKKSSKIHARTQ